MGQWTNVSVEGSHSVSPEGVEAHGAMVQAMVAVEELELKREKWEYKKAQDFQARLKKLKENRVPLNEKEGALADIREDECEMILFKDYTTTQDDLEREYTLSCRSVWNLDKENHTMFAYLGYTRNPGQEYDEDGEQYMDGTDMEHLVLHVEFRPFSKRVVNYEAFGVGHHPSRDMTIDTDYSVVYED